MEPYHPSRCATDVGATEKLKGRANGNHYAVMQVRLKPCHELFLLRSAEGYPHNIGAVGLYHVRNGGIIKIVYTAERQFHKLHAGD